MPSARALNAFLQLAASSTFKTCTCARARQQHHWHAGYAVQMAASRLQVGVAVDVDADALAATGKHCCSVPSRRAWEVRVHNISHVWIATYSRRGASLARRSSTSGVTPEASSAVAEARSAPSSSSESAMAGVGGKFGKLGHFFPRVFAFRPLNINACAQCGAGGNPRQSIVRVIV